MAQNDSLIRLTQTVKKCFAGFVHTKAAEFAVNQSLNRASIGCKLNNLYKLMDVSVGWVY